MSKRSMGLRINAAVQSLLADLGDPSAGYVSDLPIRRCGDHGWGWYVRICTPKGDTYLMFKNVSQAEAWAGIHKDK